MKTLELASDVIAGSTTFAGLIIVYVGSVATAYSAYESEAQGAVKARFRRRATLAGIGVGVAALAAATAILGKWASCNAAVAVSVFLLLGTLVWGVAVTFETIREIR